MSAGQFNAYRSDPIAEGHREQSALERSTSYRRRVVGRRVQVVSEVDFGALGTIVDVDGAELVVILDLDPAERLSFKRTELQAAAS